MSDIREIIKTAWEKKIRVRWDSRVGCAAGEIIKLLPTIMPEILPELSRSYTEAITDCIVKIRTTAGVVDNIGAKAGVVDKRLYDIEKRVEELDKNTAVVDLDSVRAKDAYLLYDKLKKLGATEETAGYALYAFLRGNGHDGCNDPELKIPKNTED